MSQIFILLLELYKKNVIIYYILFMTNIYITDIYICIHFHISQGIHISKEQTFIYAHEQSHHIKHERR